MKTNMFWCTKLINVKEIAEWRLEVLKDPDKQIQSWLIYNSIWSIDSELIDVL